MFVRKKKVLIKAYCAKNLGDDMFVLQLVRRYPHVKFFLPILKRNATAFKKEKNLEVYSFVGGFIYRILNKLKITNTFLYKRIQQKKYDILIKIGGSIFIEKKGWQNELEFADYKEKYILGANFGPYFSNEYLEHTRKFLGKFQDVCFRDNYSYDKFRDLNNVRVARDILFSYPYYPLKKTGEKVGISVISLENRKFSAQQKEEYFIFLENICQKYIKENKEIVLFAFCDAEGDSFFANRLINQFESSKLIKLCVYNGDVLEYLNRINECEIIFATRFHAMIIGWALQKKVFPIIYSDKQLNVIKDLNFTGNYWDLLHCKNHNENISTETSMDLSEMAKDSQRHFYKLEEIFGKEIDNA